MKILNINDVTTSNAMPIKSGTLQFLQDAHKEAIAGLITNVIPSPLANTIYILSGCKNTTTAPIHTLTAGVLFYNGEIFNFDGATFTLAGLEKAYARIETTQYLTNADPVQFTDGVSRNVHNIRKIKIENTTVSSGLPEFINFIDVGQWKDAITLVNSTIALLQAKDIDLQNQINALPINTIKNRGYITGIEINGYPTGHTYAVGGNISSATISTSGTSEVITVVLANTMTNTNYKVEFSIESLGTLGSDNDIRPIVWKSINATSFYVILEEVTSATQNIKLHIDVITLN